MNNTLTKLPKELYTPASPSNLKMVKRYQKKGNTFMDSQKAPAPKPAPKKPKLIVNGRNAYYQNEDGSRSPYKKNIVDKVVDRVLSPY